MKIEEAFEQFKKDVLYWQKRFELSHWKININLLSLGKECFSRTRANPVGCVADIEMNKEIPKEHLTRDEINRCAKHEVIHILTRKLRMLADNRWATPPEITMAEEELTKKLEEIIT